MFADPLLRTFMSLILCVACLGGIMIALKKYARRTRKSKVGVIDMQVLSRISLQAKSHLYIVKAGNKTLLLGATDHNITNLAELSDTGKSQPSIKSAFPTVGSSPVPKEKAIVPKTKTDTLSFKSFLAATMAKS